MIITLQKNGCERATFEGRDWKRRAAQEERNPSSGKRNVTKIEGKNEEHAIKMGSNCTVSSAVSTVIGLGSGTHALQPLLGPRLKDPCLSTEIRDQGIGCGIVTETPTKNEPGKSCSGRD